MDVIYDINGRLCNNINKAKYIILCDKNYWPFMPDFFIYFEATRSVLLITKAQWSELFFVLFILGRNIQILREQNSSCLRFLSVRRTVTCCCLMEVRHRRILFKIKVYSPTLLKNKFQGKQNYYQHFVSILSHQTKIRN